MQAIVDDILNLLEADALMKMRVSLITTRLHRGSWKPRFVVCCQRSTCFKSGFILSQSRWIMPINYLQLSRFCAGTMRLIMDTSTVRRTTSMMKMGMFLIHR